MEGLFQKFIIGLIWFVPRGYIGTLTALLFWIPAYLCQDLPVGSKQIILTEIVILSNKYFQAWIEYGQVSCQNTEHSFAYSVMLGIYTKLQLNMNFSMFADIFINNDVIISEIWMWLCGHREAENYPFQHPTPFRDKGI